MKVLLFVLVLLSFACSHEVMVTEEEIGASILYVQGTYRPFTGKCHVLYNHSKVIKEEFTVKNGILHGKVSAWHRNGTLAKKGYFSKGQLNGTWEFWDLKGNKYMEANYKNGVLDGSYTCMYSNGKPKEKGIFTNNRKSGEWIYYSTDGMVTRSVYGN